jgi:hypothetical protein
MLDMHVMGVAAPQLLSSVSSLLVSGRPALFMNFPSGFVYT